MTRACDLAGDSSPRFAMSLKRESPLQERRGEGIRGSRAVSQNRGLPRVVVGIEFGGLHRHCLSVLLLPLLHAFVNHVDALSDLHEGV